MESPLTQTRVLSGGRYTAARSRLAGWTSPCLTLCLRLSPYRLHHPLLSMQWRARLGLPLSQNRSSDMRTLVQIIRQGAHFYTAKTDQVSLQGGGRRLCFCGRVERQALFPASEGRHGGFPRAPETTAGLALAISALESRRPWSFFIWNKSP